MKIYVGEKLIDSDQEAVVLVFDNDDQRKKHAENLAQMEPKEGRRVYAVYPDDMAVNDIHVTIIDALCAPAPLKCQL
jgi:hypothetical protein